MTALVIRRPRAALRMFEPFYRPMSLFNEIEEMFRLPVAISHSFVPHTDIYEEKGELVVKTELTDVKKEDLDVTLEGDTLTIKAEKKRDETDEGATHYTSERYFGRYFRSIALPYPVDAEKVSATFENGLLEIRLPKTEEAKPRQIEVKAQHTEAKGKKRTTRRKKAES